MTVLGQVTRLQYQTLLALNGVEIRYHLDNETFVPLRAVRTKPKPTRQDIIDGIGIDSYRWDWLIDPECLVDADGNRIVPQVGHRIERICDELMHDVVHDPRENCFRWSDDSQAWMRIYTQEFTSEQ